MRNFQGGNGRVRCPIQNQQIVVGTNFNRLFNRPESLYRYDWLNMMLQPPRLPVETRPLRHVKISDLNIPAGLGVLSCDQAASVDFPAPPF